MVHDESRVLVRDNCGAVYDRHGLHRLDTLLATGFASAGPGGRIEDQWEQFDTLGVLGQLGLVPRPA